MLKIFFILMIFLFVICITKNYIQEGGSNCKNQNSIIQNLKSKSIKNIQLKKKNY